MTEVVADFPVCKVIDRDLVVRSLEYVDGGDNPDLERMIRLYPNWSEIEITPCQLNHLDWYFAPEDPLHISWKLTNNGNNRGIGDVAKRYCQLSSQELSEWGGYKKIESMCGTIGSGGSFPPVIVVPGKRYRNSPDSSFVDGVHRSLAVAVHNLRRGDSVSLSGYSGKKASIFSRALRRVSN